jgi:hypothetical protein
VVVVEAMPVELGVPIDGACLSLKQFVRAIDESSYDLNCHEDLVEAALLLRRLANNTTFLVERRFEGLRSQLKCQAGNIYAPEVLLLYTCKSYFVRANIWKPISAAENAIPDYRCDVCHDHNFDILTVGYLGAGYSCRSYTYNYGEYEGRLGEVVDLASEGVFSLTNGKVALYRAKEDVHVQVPPDQLSVSLNLIPRGSVQNEMQFQFDEASGTICRYLNFSGVEAAVRVADVLRCREALDGLTRIGSHHPSARIRALALAARIHVDIDDAEKIWSEVQAHETESVKYLVGLELAEHGSTIRGLGIRA